MNFKQFRYAVLIMGYYGRCSGIYIYLPLQSDISDKEYLNCSTQYISQWIFNIYKYKILLYNKQITIDITRTVRTCKLNFH